MIGDINGDIKLLFLFKRYKKNSPNNAFLCILGLLLFLLYVLSVFSQFIPTQSLLFYTFLQMAIFSHSLQCTFVRFIRIILFFYESGCHLVVTGGCDYFSFQGSPFLESSLRIYAVYCLSNSLFHHLLLLLFCLTERHL